ncbi:hypothetical protein [Candidatus Uabimicrobium amorphum]|uniref:AsmA domain-containing protein n=1 Tax=Uabimicrobium amorphum TaxID=2596890 RepID=A0A5S9IMW1_UABAM|nr:hypothetical protein [Candidatus Uabimicrobium amorphum]BBM84833.1 hypothetical protein UABAM_03194 [Candidatus Uabimicrobium amorphum]
MKKIGVFIAVIIVIIAGVAGYFFMSGGNIGVLIKHGIQDKGSMTLGVPVTVDKVTMPILTGKGKIENLVVENPDGQEFSYTFRIETLDLDIDPETIRTEKVHIKKIVINALEVAVEGTPQDNNITKLKESVNKPKEKKKKKVQIDHLQAQNCKLNIKLNDKSAKTIPLDSFELHNLGKNSETTMRDVTQQVVKKIIEKTTQAIKNEFKSGIHNIRDKIKEKMKDRKPPFFK